MKSATAVK